MLLARGGLASVRPLSVNMWGRSTKQGLINVSRWFAGVPSLGYGLIYILLIPIFAIIYSFLPNHFYHSTVQYEQSLNEDANEILQDLSHEIKTTFKTNHNSEQAIVHGWTVDSTSFSLYSLKVVEDEVSFRMEINLLMRGDKYAEAYLSPTVKYSLKEKLAVLPPGGKDWIEEKLIKVEPLYLITFMGDKSKERDLTRTIFPYEYEDFAPEIVVMPIPRQLDNKIMRFARGTRGFPSGVSGNLVRMFYLSAVTITTLGYGDILPLTTPSRILVSIEAILGILLIGLFLNALAYERSAKKSQEGN